MTKRYASFLPESKQKASVRAVEILQIWNAYHEAWNLGLWYLEMGILAVCGYSGTYGNRLKQRWIGQSENVAWS